MYWAWFSRPTRLCYSVHRLIFCKGDFTISQAENQHLSQASHQTPALKIGGLEAWISLHKSIPAIPGAIRNCNPYKDSRGTELILCCRHRCHGSQLTWSLRQSSTAFFPAICCKSCIVHVYRLDKQLQVKGLLNRAKWRKVDFWGNKGCELLATHLVKFSRANAAPSMNCIASSHRLAEGI